MFQLLNKIFKVKTAEVTIEKILSEVQHNVYSSTLSEVQHNVSEVQHNVYSSTLARYTRYTMCTLAFHHQIKNVSRIQSIPEIVLCPLNSLRHSIACPVIITNKSVSENIVS